jgi:hypothetical protein
VPGDTRRLWSPEALGAVRDAIAHVYADAATGPRAARRRVADAGEAKPCAYFLRGACSRGRACKFSHSGEELICPFFTKGVCRYGSKCAFLHASAFCEPAARSPTEYRTVVDRVNGNEPAGGASRHRYGTGGTRTILFGEGDFGFAAALAADGARRVVATSPLERLQDVLRDPSMAPRLRRLVAMPSWSIKFRIDATSPRAWEVVRDAFTDGDDDEAVVAVWNFPFNGDDDDTQGNASLIDAFFRTARSSLCVRSCRFEIHLALCNHQFARWKVNEAAADSFFYLVDSFDFDFEHYPYRPVRNGSETGAESSGFELEQPVVYVFC